MSESREHKADRLAVDIVIYLSAEYGTRMSESAWDRVGEPDRTMMRALAAFERGEIDFSTLEQAGVDFVEAWAAAVEPKSGATNGAIIQRPVAS